MPTGCTAALPSLQESFQVPAFPFTEVAVFPLSLIPYQDFLSLFQFSVFSHCLLSGAPIPIGFILQYKIPLSVSLNCSWTPYHLKKKKKGCRSSISVRFFPHCCLCLWFPEHPLGASLIFYFPPFLFHCRCLGTQWWFSLQFTWFIMLNPLTKCACLKSYSTVETICFGARIYYGCWGSLTFRDCIYSCINFFFLICFLLFWRSKNAGSLQSLPSLDLEKL